MYILYTFTYMYVCRSYILSYTVIHVHVHGTWPPCEIKHKISYMKRFLNLQYI